MAVRDPRPDAKWWKSATIYQIYPSSYMDSNGDGIGDLPGILSKLDYVKSIGIDAVWISPFYESPNADQGYDISDYQKPDPAYGKMEDLEAIIKGCHDRGLKILFDLVVNHSSDQHRWFKESKKSKDNPYRKYYMWQPPRFIEGKRTPPTNWQAVFGGSAWEWDDTTQEYYLHTFTIGQPDLNFEDAEVRQAIYDEAITFWLDKGIDGFRVDVSSFYSKHPYEDVPVTKPMQYEQPAEYMFIDGPRLPEYLLEMQEKTFAKYGAVTLAEMPGTRSLDGMLEYVGASSKRFSMAITFDLATVDHNGLGHYLYAQPWKLTDFKRITTQEQKLSDPSNDGWNLTYLENHDQARCISRFMNDSPEFRSVSGKTLAMYLLSTSGTPVIYQGQEIGIINMPKDWPEEEYVDPMSKMHMDKIRVDVQNKVNGITVEGGFKGIQTIGRDHARVPMQWSDAKNAGFSTTSGKTWMRVNDSYKEGINVATEDKDQDSILNFYRKMLAFRKENADTLIFGVYEDVDPDDEQTIQFYKKDINGNMLFVALNFTQSPQPIRVPQGADLQLMLSTSLEAEKEGTLHPYEGRIYKVVK